MAREYTGYINVQHHLQAVIQHLQASAPLSAKHREMPPFLGVITETITDSFVRGELTGGGTVTIHSSSPEPSPWVMKSKCGCFTYENSLPSCSSGGHGSQHPNHHLPRADSGPAWGDLATFRGSDKLCMCCF